VTYTRPVYMTNPAYTSGWKIVTLSLLAGVLSTAGFFGVGWGLANLAYNLFGVPLSMIGFMGLVTGYVGCAVGRASGWVTYHSISQTRRA
jgi:hypothetical protein